MSKSWYHSKTIWVNGLAALALLVQAFTGFVVDLQVQAAVIVIANLLLRVLTREPIE